MTTKPMKQKTKATKPLAPSVIGTPTPGPWRTGGGSESGAANAIYVNYETERSPGRRLAIFYTPSVPASYSITPEDRANARLAAAAPALLAICKMLVDWDYTGLATAGMREIIAAAHAAIAACEGSTNTQPPQP